MKRNYHQGTVRKTHDLSWGRGGGGGTLEGSLGAGVPLSPSNPEHVEDKMILSFRFPVFVTQSPRLFSLSSRNALPDFGEDVNTIEAS